MDDVMMMTMVAMMMAHRGSERAERDRGQHGGDEDFETETRGKHDDSWVGERAVHADRLP